METDIRQCTVDTKHIIPPHVLIGANRHARHRIQIRRSVIALFHKPELVPLYGTSVSPRLRYERDIVRGEYKLCLPWVSFRVGKDADQLIDENGMQAAVKLVDQGD